MGNRCLPTLPPFHQVSLVLLNGEGCNKYLWPFGGRQVPSFFPYFHLFQQQYFKCNQCNSSFIDTSTLRTHLKTQSGEQSNNALYFKRCFKVTYKPSCRWQPGDRAPLKRFPLDTGLLLDPHLGANKNATSVTLTIDVDQMSFPCSGKASEGKYVVIMGS